MALYPLGFEKQKLSTMWACGAYSFGHLLNLFGIPNYVNENIKVCKTIPHPMTFKFWNGGTSEESIKRALKKIGFMPKDYYGFNDTRIKKTFDYYSKINQPVIISVDNDQHWMLFVKRYEDKYIIIDSGGSETNTILFYKWETLRGRLKTECDDCEGDKVEWCSCCDGYGEDETGYCTKCKGYGYIGKCRKCNGSGFRFYGIVPGRTQIKSINVYALKNIDKYINILKNNYNLQERWGYYLNDLIDVSENNFGIHKDSVLLYDFLSKNYNKIVDNIDYWFADIEKKDLEDEFKNYLIVAEAYQFCIPINKKEETLISFSSLLIGAMLY